MKINKKFFAFFGIFIVGFGLGAGGMILKEMFFPSEKPDIVYVERKPDEIGPLIDLGEFMVNLSGGGILKTEITVEGYNSKSAEPIQEKEIFLRDCVIAVLSSKKITDVSTASGRNNLKSELVAEMNKICTNEIQDVLFKSFLYSF